MVSTLRHANYVSTGKILTPIFSHDIVFELTNGTRKVFPAPSNMYKLIIEGDSGILSYKEQGKLIRFISFQRNNNST